MPVCECKVLDYWSTSKDDICGILVCVIASLARYVNSTNTEILEIAHTKNVFLVN